MKNQRNILTIATGNSIYLEMAYNLIRSFLYRNDHTKINFQLVTDSIKDIPTDLLNKIEIIKINPKEYGIGFSTKLYLDKFIKPGQTLFVDSDCLIFGNVTEIFEKFNGRSVSVVGDYISNGEWFGNVEQICKSFDIKQLPKFNGGIYYLEKSEITTQVYECARALEKRYDEIGFVRLRNQPNDEVVMALSMELHNLKPVEDDGSIMGDPFAYPAPYEINIETGKRMLKNPPASHPDHRIWNKNIKVEPLIVHFLGSHTDDYRYKREVYKLKYLLKNNLTSWQRIKVTFVLDYPSKVKIFIKQTFRPAYRFLFGARRIKISKRIGV